MHISIRKRSIWKSHIWFKQITDLKSRLPNGNCNWAELWIILQLWDNKWSTNLHGSFRERSTDKLIINQRLRGRENNNEICISKEKTIVTIKQARFFPSLMLKLWRRMIIWRITHFWFQIRKNWFSFKYCLKTMTRVQKLTVLPRRNAAPAPIAAPMESATKPTGSPKR